MKKARKGMLLSLLSLVFALAITATSTYAWFVVNREVTASNMQVRVKSDTTYLVISATDSLDNVTATELNTFTAGDPVLPAAYVQESGHEAEAGAWKKGKGAAYNSSTLTGGYQDVTPAEISGEKYFKKYTFWVGLTPTSRPAQDLKVSAISAEVVSGSANTFLPAVSAVVNYGDVWLDFEDINSTATQNGISARAALLDSIAINTPYQINVYLYINGDNTVVTSDNALPANLGSFNVTVSLQCTPIDN